MMIIVGAPVHHRGWILRDWFEHLANQEDFPSQEMGIVLNYGKSTDDTLEIIESEQQSKRWKSVVMLQDQNSDHVEPRLWTLDRYATMVRLRNDLLAYVRKESPDYFLSCDTDMLLPPHTLHTLFSHLGNFNGIAPLTFMTTEGEMFPNCMAMDGSRQSPPKQTCQQYAVFGTVLMDEQLYSQVDYALHGLGEDLGWARTAWERGLKLAICPEVRVKHVMNLQAHGELDVRVGF